MKIFFLIALLWGFAWSLNIEQAIERAIKNSDKIQEQNYLSSYASKLSQAKISSFMPQLDLNYIFSYNTPNGVADYFLNSFNLGVKYNIFNGFKDYYALKDSKQNQKRQSHILQSSIADVILETKIAYIALLQALDSLQIAQEGKSLLEAQRKKAQQFYKQGFRAKNEVLSVEVLLANALIVEKSAKLNLEYSKNKLENLTASNLKLNDNEDGDRLEDVVINTDIVFDKKALFKQVLLTNSDYLALRSLVVSAQNQIKIAKGSFLPKIDIVGSKFWYFDGGNIARANYGLQNQARIVFGWNLFDGLRTSYSYQAQKFYHLSLLSKINQYEKDIKIQINKLINEFELAKEQYFLASVSLKQAEENYRITNNRYAQNIAAYIELLNAQLLLNTAKTNLIASKYEIALSLAKIERITNSYIPSY